MIPLFGSRYNPAYEFFLLRYFNKNGITIDTEFSFERAKRIALKLQERAGSAWSGKEFYNPSSYKTKLNASETLFCEYVWRWGSVPEAKPSYQEFFIRTIDVNHRPHAKELRELESQLPDGWGKLVFTVEDAAEAITQFYRKYVKEPLSRDLVRGATGRELTKYFSLGEFDLLPRINEVGEEKHEERLHVVVERLQVWLEKITQEKILGDIKVVFEKHDKSEEHTKVLHDPIRGDERVCEHDSEYVKLSGYSSLREASRSVILQPVRGHRAIEDIVGPGWEDIVFPWFYGLQE